jgi:hypothetical protein
LKGWIHNPNTKSLCWKYTLLGTIKWFSQNPSFRELKNGSNPHFKNEETQVQQKFYLGPGGFGD